MPARRERLRAARLVKLGCPIVGESEIQLVSVLTPFALDLIFGVMGDKSPKATHKQAAQKQAKANAANQKKSNTSSTKQVPKPK